MKNGSDAGLIYWKLNYKSKFIRTLWMIPICFIAIILLLITDGLIPRTVILSLLIVVTLILQLIYTNIKWKNECNSDNSS
ncbi:putative membrane protein [Natronobacillus azotifigens]|uniref:SdpI family protein n=1 Tax=Natronobacillus azotifigens TaxID=472978 RepID=A0A9J6R982_9BACI|nr:hypothetical protein [Natronobacillus azotifigens]MCZ0701833.1 hypothetical protein [Natronobacillus azotifigens]